MTGTLPNPAKIALLVVLFLGARASPGAELVTLGATNYGEYAPAGKEVDAIYGDFALRSDKLVAVIGRPAPGRNANVSVHSVGGSLIDLTTRARPNDQLTAFFPGGRGFHFTSIEAVSTSGLHRPGSDLADSRLEGETVWVECTSQPEEGKAQVTVRYTLREGEPFLRVDSTYHNPSDHPIEIELLDSLRADRTFAFGSDPSLDLYFAYDDWFRQAYGFVVEGYSVRREGGSALFYDVDGSSKITLPAGGTRTLHRKIVPGANLLAVKGIAHRLARTELHEVTLRMQDPMGPVAGAKVSVSHGSAVYGSGRTAHDGVLVFDLPEGEYDMTISAIGRPDVSLPLAANAPVSQSIEMAASGYVVGHITDGNGDPVPCKIEFSGIGGTDTPYFGPDSKAVTVHNLYYSHHGRFRQEIGPGRYEVIISHGPEYDAVFTQIQVTPGEETLLEAQLARSVHTAGWVSADFHSHSSPSGDNTSSQLGRVLNLLCEHIEFAPCTEHNRLSSYVPHLERLGVLDQMATCTGIELTGGPGDVNHQNAFPLILRQGLQDHGAPQTDWDPVVQIERLARWDERSEKLVQVNHPNIVRILADKDLDGLSDGGYERMFSFMDVIEVHPPHEIFFTPTADPNGQLPNNRIFRWMQSLNLGYRVPGVVNTDAHYTYHGSGFLRNYLSSPTDDPARIRTLDMVRAAEQGHVIMTNGPFLEVYLFADQDNSSTAIAGDEVLAPGGKTRLALRVQCANWLDINRVQVFENGRPIESLNFTRQTTPQWFRDDVVKFEAELSLELAGDAHIIVVAAGEGLSLGPVLGPERGAAMPIAVSNPIFVDVDGNGFQANGNLLGVPLPLNQE